jgi:hypothetical protein
MLATIPRVKLRRNPWKSPNKLNQSTSRVQIVTRSVREGLGSPTALRIGSFSVTLTTLSLMSLSLIGQRNLSNDNVCIGNF